MGSIAGNRVNDAAGYAMPAQEMAPIQASLEGLRSSLARLGESVSILGEKLGPVRVYSQLDEKAPKGLTPVPTMSNIELAVHELTETANVIHGAVITLQDEVRL